MFGCQGGSTYFGGASVGGKQKQQSTGWEATHVHAPWRFRSYLEEGVRPSPWHPTQKGDFVSPLVGGRGGVTPSL